MGYWPLGLGEAFRALLLTALLFLGPLFESLVVEGYWREWMTGEPVKELLSDWITWRNLVAVSARAPPPSPPFNVFIKHSTKCHILGPPYRRNSFPLRRDPSHDPGTHLPHKNHLRLTPRLWPRSRTPPLRVPHHAPKRAPPSRHPALCLPARLHDAFRCVRHVRLPA